MIINFSVGNYRSIKSISKFTMQQRGSKTQALENTFKANGLPSSSGLLKSSIIYGANASGKSNLLRALAAMRNIIVYPKKQDEINDYDVEAFAFDEESIKSPTFFELEFIASGKRYRYGFECDSNKIHSEWLFVQKKRMTLLFTRENNKFVNGAKDFSELQAWTQLTNNSQLTIPENALFLVVAAKIFAGGHCENVFKWFAETLVILFTESYHRYLPYTIKSMNDVGKNQQISSFIRKADFGINAIQRIEKAEIENTGGYKELQVKTTHSINGKNYQLDLLHNESDGTKKVFALSGPLLDVIENGKVLFIDELDAGLHPLLVNQILDIFHKNNPQNAQIIATAHSPSILTELQFRRDQIWFVNKQKDGSSEIVSLTDFSGIRGNFSKIVKDYLHGCFGGVPYIKDLLPVEVSL